MAGRRLAHGPMPARYGRRKSRQAADEISIGLRAAGEGCATFERWFAGLMGGSVGRSGGRLDHFGDDFIDIARQALAFGDTLEFALGQFAAFGL